MPFDEDLRRQFETLTDRIRDQVTRQLEIATGELATSVEAERAAAVSQAAADANASADQVVAAAERDAAARLTEAVATTERDAAARLTEAVAATERDAAARLTEAVAATERDAAARLTEAVAAAEREAATRLTEAVAGAERDAAARLTEAVAGAERDAAARLTEAVAAAERDAAVRLNDALAAAEQVAAARLTDAIATAERAAAARLSDAVTAAEQEAARLAEAAAARLTDGVAAAEQEAAARLTDAVVAAEERGRVKGLEEGQQKGIAQGREEGRDGTRAEARFTQHAAGERLIEALRAIDRARSLSEILDTLISRAGREAARVSVLLVRGGQLRAWRSIGFDSAVDDASAFELPLDEGGIIAESVRTREATVADSGHGATVPSFTQLPPGREMLAVPITISGQVVAVLYADQAAEEAAGDGRPESLVVWPVFLEVLARHATRCLEVTTAFRAAQRLTGGAKPSAVFRDASAHGRPRAEPVIATPEANTGDEDEAARRYARLLISEIKLYHEPEVIAGRRDRDVVSRLGGEIARARVLYEQRVPAHVRSTTDHFQAELVRTLADGDPSLLGLTT